MTLASFQGLAVCASFISLVLWRWEKMRNTFWLKAIAATITGLAFTYFPALIANELRYAIDHWYSFTVLLSLGFVFGAWYRWNKDFTRKELPKTFAMGFFVAAGFPVVSVIDMMLHPGSHNLFPIENFIYLVTGLLCGGTALLGLGFASFIKKTTANE
ncbi:MAG: hypothetical protein ACYC69_18305 [Thermodesulfovibrionales bacterium]